MICRSNLPEESLDAIARGDVNTSVAVLEEASRVVQKMRELLLEVDLSPIPLLDAVEVRALRLELVTLQKRVHRLRLRACQHQLDLCAF